MLPQRLVVEFWLRVRDSLVEVHHASREEADRGIDQYLQLAERHEFTQAIYHRNAEEVAEIVAHGMKRGFPEPQPNPKKEPKRRVRI